MGEDLQRENKKLIAITSVVLAVVMGATCFLFLLNVSLESKLEAKNRDLETYRQKNDSLLKINSALKKTVKDTQVKNENLNKRVEKVEKEKEELEVVLKKEQETKSPSLAKETKKGKKNIKQLAEEQSKEWMDFEMTHYTAYCKGCSGTTFSGHDARESIYSNGNRVIATDRNVIPQGSIVEIRDGDVTFKAQALDIGSAIKGNLVDLLVEGKDTALKLGRKNVQIRIIREGWD